MIQKENARKICYFIGWMITGILAAAAVFLQMHPVRLSSAAKCLLKRFGVGLYCPGCGGTRAFFALMMGHPMLSFYFHPVVPYIAVIFLWYMFSNTIDHMSKGHTAIGSRYHNYYLYGAFVIIIVNWILRNILLIVFHIPLG